ncbi:MAG: hypothetical protein M3170_12795 [Candidatus Dormibacteraeota bacterium]|nr:hypothetical protein [Candidatus Dormibacteraeota bacterium]
MYGWLLFAHIASVAGFLLGHGTSAAMAFRLRSEKTTDGIRSLTELSKQTTGVMYGFLVLIVISGVFLGFQGGWWGRAWIWTALVVLILTIGAMSALGGRFNAVRGAVGLAAWDRRGKVTTSAPGSPEEIRRAVSAAPVGIITAIGVVALVLLLWLMILKPF